ncbi:gliding motility lipoprotein GldH [Flammeovirga sp. EKP202]|uniref:gliding motility lipoprotein GldH n=1 Tax=Flammeovirga sp. EKP202 TaxID=2770592 RepID=UPI00165FBB71|nr:gliding motility lipoprotein GldH [Flammeovirga sp. EKP202]MBD0402518.1 gliding motility lipoprotein GldH [Flammeovirga sp. EKP202]
MSNPTKIVLPFLCLILSLFMISCDSQMVHEEFVDYENETWNIDSLASFQFDVEDINTEYNLITYIRNTNDYPFQNIYIKYSLVENGTLDEVDTLVAETMKDCQLFKMKTGEPFGKVEQSIGNSSTGAIYNHPVKLKENFKFPKKGNYTFQVAHFMRPDELTGVIGVGYRLEKVEKN